MLQRRDRLQHAVERRSGFIGERGAFEAVEPDGAVLARGKGGDGGHHAVEFRQAACVGVGIALDQPAARQHFHAEIIAALQRRERAGEPGFAMRRLAGVA